MDAIELVDGTPWLCWSGDGESKLWSGKCKSMGHGSLVAANLHGRESSFRTILPATSTIWRN
jgi:hypothetical protein